MGLIDAMVTYGFVGRSQEVHYSAQHTLLRFTVSYLLTITAMTVA